ncbi:MAG: 7-cyano-7-deazaguanine synthase [Elusimicrobia bacterium]|nr:7-cyano-7-deazaguanine synthase [Elusimicrobiota bacterium]
MASFCGVWSVSGEPVAGVASPERRRALRARVAGGAGGVVEVEQGPLWLAVPAGRLRRGDSDVLAWDGFLPSAVGTPDPDAPWEGHYSLAHADFSARRLTLMRDLGGGEDLFYIRTPEAVVFANSVRPLLEWCGDDRRIETEALAQLLFNGPAPLGGVTFFRGIRELEPGESVVVERGSWRRTAPRLPFLEPDRPGQATPAEFRKLLKDATGRAIAGDREVAVALSGGIDSATVAALAVEHLGAAGVCAYTFEFDEPAFPSETKLAQVTAKRLGIRHQVVRITRRKQLAAAPRYCWAVQEGRMRGNPARMLLAEAAAAAGAKKLLTGDGVEQLLGSLEFRPYLHELARNIGRTPFAGWALSTTLPLVKRVMPARASWPPHPDIRGAVATTLRRRGVLKDLARFYSPRLVRFARAIEESKAIGSAVGDSSETLLSALTRVCHHYNLMPRMLWKRVAMGRAAGVSYVAPAMLRDCIGEAPRFAAETWSVAEEYSRHLQREAVAADVAPEVLGRHKLREQAVGPSSWIPDLVAMVEAGTDGLAGLAPYLTDEELRAARRHHPYPLAQAALMSRVFLEGPPRDAAPAWSDLGRVSEAAAA